MRQNDACRFGQPAAAVVAVAVTVAALLSRPATHVHRIPQEAEAEASSTAGGDDEPFQDGSDSASSGNGDGNEDPAFMTAEMSGERDDNGGDHDTPRGVVGGLAWASPLANPRALDDIETPKRDALDLSAGSDGGYSTEGHDLA